MDTSWLKVMVGSANVVLLCAGAATWLVGRATQNASCKRVGTYLLSAWLVYDLMAFILAFCLGWFA